MPEESEVPLETGVKARRTDYSALSPFDFAEQMKKTADLLVADGATRGEMKLLASVLKELRTCFKIFGRFKDRKKVTIFGSARTPKDSAAYKQAVDFGHAIAGAGYMVVTGAASGIMEAGHVGAEREMSLGVNISLPFEQSANPIIFGDSKLMTMKYFFTRKLMFVKDAHAIVLFPGGFGTQDEGYEVLTLIQTGKSHLMPVVCIDEPGGGYWKAWDRFVREQMLDEKMISPPDLHLYKVTDRIDEAVAEIEQFYRVYHSMRYVRGRLYLRLKRPISDATLQHLKTDFADICPKGDFEVSNAHPTEVNEPEIFDLPRLKFQFDRRQHGRLRMLVDRVNAD